jgi:hypothetical protein
MNRTVSVFHHDDVILLQHRQQNVLQFGLLEFPFLNLCFHGFARGEVRKTAHKKEGVRVFDGEKGT